MNSRTFSWAFVVVAVVCLFSGIIPVTGGITIPFFGTFGTKQKPPSIYNEQKDARIINADHGGSSSDGASATASLAGGSFGRPSPWISGTRDQFIRDQLVILHPDSPLNRDAWKESGYLTAETEASKDFSEHSNGMMPSARTPPGRVRKPMRKSKQQTAPTKTDPVEDPNGSQQQNTNNVISLPPPPVTGGMYEFLPTPLAFYRDLNFNQNNGGELTAVDDDPSSNIHHEPIFLPANNYLLPLTSPMFPYSPRGIISHSTLPPEAVIQLLKSPEQEMSPLTRPQVKLPFPLSRDCSANNGGASGSKPLQFVVLPIVEPVAPLKPIFPKPSFLSSQYGQFPYIPPFNLFNKKPPVFPTSNLDGSSSNGLNQASGQFVPILNRPAPPLPFVFVQSLPLELIEHNMEMDVLNSSPSQTSESKINEVSPIAVPPSPSPPSALQQSMVSSSMPMESISSPSRPLPLIVIEKVKTPGQPPSQYVSPAATVVEISKQSIPKSGSGSGSSTISVVKPITAPGSEPHTPQQQQEIHKAIEKLVPVAAAVLENVEQQQKQQKDGKDPTLTVPLVAPKEPVVATTSGTTESVKVMTTTMNEQEKPASLRPPLRPDPTKESVVPQKESMMSSVSEEIVGIGVNPTAMSDVEITEA